MFVMWFTINSPLNGFIVRAARSVRNDQEAIFIIGWNAAYIRRRRRRRQDVSNFCNACCLFVCSRSYNNDNTYCLTTGWGLASCPFLLSYETTKLFLHMCVCVDRICTLYSNLLEQFCFPKRLGDLVVVAVY